MSLRAKTIIMITCGVLILMSVTTGVMAYIQNRGFAKVENDQVQVNVQRVEQMFQAEIEAMNTKLSDWASWDDSYAFLHDKNRGFIDSNLTDTSLVNLKVHFMVFIDEKGTVIYEKVHIPGWQDEQSLVKELEEQYTKPGGIRETYVRGETKSGFIRLSKGPLLVVSRPVLNSNGEGPSHGALLFGRLLDQAEIDRLGARVKLKLELYSLDKLIKNHGPAVLDELQGGGHFAGITMSPTLIEGYTLFRDIYGAPAFPIEVKLDRQIYQQAQKTIYTSAGVGLFSTVILLLFMLLGTSRIIIAPIARLMQDIDELGKHAGISSRLPVRNTKDELGKVGDSINSLLTSVEHAQRLLSQERERSQMYLNSIGVMIVVVGEHGDISLVNKTFCGVVQYSEKDLVGNNWFDRCVPPAIRDETQSEFSGFVAGDAEKSGYSVNLNILASNGSVRLIHWRITQIRDSENRVTALLFAGDDITETHRVQEEQIRKNRELEQTKSAVMNVLDDAKHLEEKITTERDQANSIISTMREGLFLVDTNNSVTLVNHAAEELLGVPTGEILGKKLNDFTVFYRGARELPLEERPLWRTLHTGESYSFGLEDDHYLEGKNGKIPVAITTVPVRHGGTITGALVTFHDVSKDKQVKETIEHEVVVRTAQIQDERAKLVASINSLNVGYLLLDTSGKPLIANSLISTVLGSTNTIVTIQDIDSMFGETFDLVHRFATCIADKKIIYESDISYRGKILKIWLIPVVVVENAMDKVIGAVFLAEDITERKIMERSKDEFFSIASHELRTPLTAIRGNTSMILDFYGDKIPDKDMKEMIEDIHVSSIRLIDIVNDFLNVSRLEQGKIDFNVTEFDMNELVKKSVVEFEGSALEKHVVVRFDDPGTVFTVKADKDRTKQVILNLIGNSLKFTEKGEVVSFLVRDGDMVRFRVTDSGRGIPKDNQSLLFHKFQQAGSSLFTRDTTKGTGLGLYISRLIIEGMGGKIWLEKSEEGVGSEFCFTLPVVK